MHWSVGLAISSVSEAAVFSAIGAGISVVAVVLALGDFVPAFGFILLIEATGLMIIGGALDMSTSGSARSIMKQLRIIFGRTFVAEAPVLTAVDRKSAHFAAARYSLTGVLLFVEALLIAVALY